MSNETDKLNSNNSNNVNLNSPSTSSISNGYISSNTITVLDAPMNGKVYLVGTAHFSLESQREVSELIRNVQPNCVVLELCSARVNILKFDEETVLKEAKDMNMGKLLKLIKEV